jgi:hypothetical protein
MPLQALALVVSPRLGSQQRNIEKNKQTKEPHVKLLQVLLMLPLLLGVY